MDAKRRSFLRLDVILPVMRTNNLHTQPPIMKTTTPQTKPAEGTQSVSVGYCYASSISATKHGHAKGCWYVETIEHGQCIGERAFVDRADAFAFADSLSLPFHKYSVTR